MQIQGIYAALATASMDRAETFYTRLFGRGPDDRPMDGLIQWRNVAGANIQIFRDKENAGYGRLTIVVPKMDEARKSLEDFGGKLTAESQGDYGKIAQLADPDGNRITLAEPPSRPFKRSSH
jgi:predicted enzyme related to lactoylglutathione lyase